MKTLVVTGGIGSGKSLVCRHLASQGIPVYDSDSRTKRLYDEDPSLIPALEQALALPLRDEAGHLDRSVLAAAVFGDAARLAILEEIVHPRVYADYVRWRDSQPGSAPFAVFESAIFLQKPLFRPLADRVLLIDAPASLRAERVAARDALGMEEIARRMHAQQVDPSLADAVIVNDGTPEALFAAVDAAMETIWKPKNEKDMKTDLSKILTVSGQHGLFNYLAQARNGIIAESLATKKRTALDAHSRVNTLADISIYTSEGELKLKDVFLALKETLGDKPAPTSKSSPDALKALFARAIPDYDEDRFYVSHMKKVIDWYNEIAQFASFDFVEEEAVEEETEEAAEDPANA
jgi:dephospho-CoA kinase